MATVDLITEAEYRTQAEQANTTTTPSPLLAAMITAASRVIGRRYDREFISEASGSTTRRFRVDGRRVTLAPYDIRSASGLVVTLHPESASPQTLVSGTDYAVVPGAATPGWRIQLAASLNLCSTFADSFGFANLDVTGTAAANWGVFANTAGVAEDVKRACVLTVSSWLDRPTTEYAGFGLEGEGVQLRPDSFAGWPIPASAHRLLAPWQPVKVY